MVMFRKKGQITLEYLAVVTLLLAVFLAAGNYFRRGVQGRWKAATDDIGEQYDPRTADTDITHKLTANTETRVTTIDDAQAGGFWTMRFDKADSKEEKTGYSTIGAN